MVFDPKNERTDRGFSRFEFIDHNQKECSLQQSSIVDEEYCLWLGCMHNAPDHLGHTMSPRMHLTQTQAEWLGKKLLKFAKTGDFE